MKRLSKHYLKLLSITIISLATSAAVAQSFDPSSYLHPKNTNVGTIGILAVAIKIPTFDEVTRQKTGELELKAGDTVTIIDTEPDGVIIEKGGSIRIKQPLSIIKK